MRLVPTDPASLEDAMEEQRSRKKIWKLVLTGGPCGGKTTGQARLSTFFENLGWKVYRVPEMATIIIPGGVNFAELDADTAMRFQVEYKRAIFISFFCHLNNI